MIGQAATLYVVRGEGGELDGATGISIDSGDGKAWTVFLKRDQVMQVIEQLIECAHLDDELSPYPPQ